MFISILHIDDEPEFLNIIKIFLEKSNKHFLVTSQTSPITALELLKSQVCYDIIISDYQMPEMTGLDLLREIRYSGNAIPFIMLTGKGREEVVIQALNLNADYYLQKGTDFNSMLSELENFVIKAHKHRLLEDQVKKNIKLLNTINDISKILENFNADISITLDSIIKIIPQAFIYSEPVSVRIVIEDTEYKSLTFSKSQNVFSTFIIANNREYGFIEVNLPISPSQSDEQFKSEEKHFIEDIGVRLGLFFEHKEHVTILNRINRSYKALLNIEEELGALESEPELLKKVCNYIVDNLGYKLSWIGYIDREDVAKIVHPVAFAGFNDEYLDAVTIKWDDSRFGRGPTGMAIKTGHYQLTQNTSMDHNYTPWRIEGSKRGYASSIALPLKTPDYNVYGALNIYASEKYAFIPEEISLLLRLTAIISDKIINFRQNRTTEYIAHELATLKEKIPKFLDLIPGAALIFSFEGENVFMLSSFNKKALELSNNTIMNAVGKDIHELFSDDLIQDVITVFNSNNQVSGQSLYKISYNTEKLLVYDISKLTDHDVLLLVKDVTYTLINNKNSVLNKYLEYEDPD